MKLAVSSIAWTKEEEPEVAKLLQSLGVKYVEVAPTKNWQDPTSAPKDEAVAYVQFWRDHGIEIVAFQSMLFNRPDLKLFESPEGRQELQEYLQKFIGLAGDMGAGVMVFGSPKNRQRGEMELAQAQQVAKEFFSVLGDTAQQHNVRFCIEPNPTDYACDFVTTAQQGLEFVQALNNPGFGLHLDIAGMTLAGDDIAASITAAAPLLQHFHISTPFLEKVEPDTDVNHELAAQTLRSIGYDKFVSIEMRPGEQGQNVQRVETAVRFAQSIYS